MPLNPEVLVFDVCDRITDDLQLAREESKDIMMRKNGSTGAVVATNLIIDCKTGPNINPKTTLHWS